MTRPLIGISADTREHGGERAQLVIERYLEAVVRHAEVDAVIVPARSDLVDACAIAARLDGLLLTGSPSNVAPTRYGDDDEGVGPFDAGRDGMAFAMVEALLARGRPILGICRGLQELNVAFGGTLTRDLGDAARLLPHHAPAEADLPAMFAHGHDVALAPGGVLAQALAVDRLRVNSVHFQGIARLGDGLVAEATAADGLIEAFAARNSATPVLAVQWHPEWNPAGERHARVLFSAFGRALRGEPSLTP